jgi:hypothetical protein
MADGIDCDVKRYPDAGQGVLNDHRPSGLPWINATAKLTAAGYDEPASQDARRRHQDLRTTLVGLCRILRRRQPQCGEPLMRSEGLDSPARRTARMPRG